MPQFWAKEKGGAWSKYLPGVTLPDAKNRIKIRKSRRAKRFRLFCALFALVCRFVEQVEQLQGKAVWSEFAPILGKGKKAGIGNQYLPKGTLTDAKNVCR